MGVPINLFCATNINDNVEMFFEAGVYEMGGNVRHTPANAMDIRYPYNVERILYLFTDAQTTVNIVTKNKSQISPETKSKISNYVNGSFKAETSQIYNTMRSCWEQNNFMVKLCQHISNNLSNLMVFRSALIPLQPLLTMISMRRQQLATRSMSLQPLLHSNFQKVAKKLEYQAMSGTVMN